MGIHGERENNSRAWLVPKGLFFSIVVKVLRVKVWWRRLKLPNFDPPRKGWLPFGLWSPDDLFAMSSTWRWYRLTKPSSRYTLGDLLRTLSKKVYRYESRLVDSHSTYFTLLLPWGHSGRDSISATSLLLPETYSLCRLNFYSCKTQRVSRPEGDFKGMSHFKVWWSVATVTSCSLM